MVEQKDGLQVPLRAKGGIAGVTPVEPPLSNTDGETSQSKVAVKPSVEVK
jgi:hypothetical protein